MVMRGVSVVIPVFNEAGELAPGAVVRQNLW